MSAKSLDASALAALMGPMVGSALIGFDVDGVLAPIVAHADDATLSPGVHQALGRLAERGPIAVVSGRSLESLDRLFDFPDTVFVIGSHGAERRGHQNRPLDERERDALEQVTILGTKTVEEIGPGAWLETKPTSVVVHTFNARPDAISEPLVALTNLAAMVDGAAIKAGSNVLELMVRSVDKGTALVGLGAELGVAVGGFVGDDVTDEDAFAALGPEAVTVKVGDADTVARFRIPDPAAVAAMLALIS